MMKALTGAEVTRGDVRGRFLLVMTAAVLACVPSLSSCTGGSAGGGGGKSDTTMSASSATPQPSSAETIEGPHVPPNQWAAGIERAAGELPQFFAQYPDHDRRFAGAWIATDGQSLGIAIKDTYYATTATQLAAFMAQHAPNVRYTAVAVKRSDQDLDTLKQQVLRFVYGDTTPSTIADVSLVALSPLVQTNQLHVQLLPGHEDLANAIREHFGEVLLVTNDGVIVKLDSQVTQFGQAQ